MATVVKHAAVAIISVRIFTFIGEKLISKYSSFLSSSIDLIIFEAGVSQSMC